MIDLKGNPFFLNEEQEEWVKNTFTDMSVEEKIGQVFCPNLTGFDDETIDYYTKKLKVGAVMIRPFAKEGLAENIRKLQRKSKIPLLISANLENGGNGAFMEGTLFSQPLGCAASNDPANGYRLGKISCNEAASVGVNQSFAPIVDIDKNYHNPITNVRTFGANPETVLKYAKEYIRAANEENVIATIKHFPGDGTDERDQHLLVSVNDCSAEECEKSYGKIYKTLIDDGICAVMAGHIAAPNVIKSFDSSLDEEECHLPATQSKTLLTKLLRGKLGFNGMIITDSTLMVGYMEKMPRSRAIPYSIECGADMILFNRSIEEDIEYLKTGLQNDILSQKRLDEAVERILALKAKLNLNIENFEKPLVNGNMLTEEIKSLWTRECADKAVTLVKDTKKVLPLSPLKNKRIYLNVIENTVDNNSPFAENVKKRLEREGFEVTLRRRDYGFDPSKLTLENFTPEADEAIKEVMCNTKEFTDKYDAAIIFLNMRTASNATVVRINWNVLFGMGNDLPWYSGEMPLIAVSVNNPYHLLDIPMAHAYVNAYTCNETVLDAVFEKLMGRSEFKGISPIDPFCGKSDTRL